MLKMIETEFYRKQVKRLVAARSKSLKKINSLLESIQATPRAGLGRPKPLKGEFKGCWSRRIDRKNRLVYKVDDAAKTVTLLACRGHYGDH